MNLSGPYLSNTQLRNISLSVAVDFIRARALEDFNAAGSQL